MAPPVTLEKSTKHRLPAYSPDPCDAKLQLVVVEVGVS
jgi:hypothetical protein